MAWYNVRIVATKKRERMTEKQPPDTDAYLAETVRKAMELAPAVRDAIVTDLLTELKEEIARREDARYSRATIALIEAIEDDWRNRG